MPRLLAIAALSLFVAQATGIGHLPELSGCEAPCPDDGPKGECPPGCRACACCTPRSPVQPTANSIPVPLATLEQRLVVATVELPTSPDPDEILHVPKRTLA